MVQQIMHKKYDDRYAESFLKGLKTLTGIPYRKLQNYANTNNLFNILEHPNTIKPNQQQLQKISILNEFISSYRLLKMQEEENKITFDSSACVGEYFTSILCGVKDREKFMVAFLDNGNNIIETRTVSEGGLSEVVVYPRDILKSALDNDCKGIVIAHNHRGGSLKASIQDLVMTERIVSIFKPLEINVLDHIIVAGGRYISFAERGCMPDGSSSKINYEPVAMNNHSEAQEERLEFNTEKIQKVENEIEEEDEWEM